MIHGWGLTPLGSLIEWYLAKTRMVPRCPDPTARPPQSHTLTNTSQWKGQAWSLGRLLVSIYTNTNILSCTNSDKEYIF